MGIDCHMYIVKNKEYVKENIFDGRNSEWFFNMMGDGNADEYNTLPIHYGISEQSPDAYDAEFSNWCFSFRYINVEDFKNWFEKTRPDKDAGWVTRYDKWAYENKGIEPEEICHYLSSLGDEVDKSEFEFIEIENRWDCSRWLYNYLIDNDISDEADIQYCFDH